jgi:hypothetical protein
MNEKGKREIFQGWGETNGGSWTDWSSRLLQASHKSHGAVLSFWNS